MALLRSINGAGQKDYIAVKALPSQTCTKSVTKRPDQSSQHGSLAISWRPLHQIAQFLARKVEPDALYTIAQWGANVVACSFRQLTLNPVTDPVTGNHQC